MLDGSQFTHNGSEVYAIVIKRDGKMFSVKVAVEEFVPLLKAHQLSTMCKGIENCWKPAAF